MQCDEIQLDLSVFLNGELPPDRQAAVERHLTTCQACSEEAAAMQDVGDVLSRGLKRWVDQGVCPPELLDRIELSLRPTRKRQPWYRAWPAYAGAVAAAAILLVVLGSQVDLSHQVASIPLVGTLAAQLFYPSADMQVDDVSTKRPTDVLAKTEHDGLELEVYRVTTTTEAVRVQYALRGANLDSRANLTRYGARLAGAKGDLKLRNVHVVRDADEVLVEATYEPVLPGQALTLTVTNPPLKAEAGAPANGTWEVSVKP